MTHASISGTVEISRELLAKALEQIEATWQNHVDDCDACGAAWSSLRGDIEHKPGCRYVDVRDGLTGLLFG